MYDYFSLEEGEYLNDAIINFHLAYLAQEKLSDDNKKDVHIFSTHFYTKLSKQVLHNARFEDSRRSYA